MKTVIIIPARMASERLPGKPLKQIGGRSVIWNCYMSAKSSDTVQEIFVASPDEEILQEVGHSIMTSDAPINGTERVAEAARTLKLELNDIVVNLQGDMPFFDKEIIDNPVRLLKATGCNVTSVMTTLSKKDHDKLNKVKVNIDKNGCAVLFNRKYRENAYLHIGVYVFRNSFLQKYDAYGLVAEERLNHLEQKRIVHMNEPIYMSYVASKPVVIDTDEDLKEAKRNNAEN